MTDRRSGKRQPKGAPIRGGLGCAAVAFVVFALPFACQRSHKPEEPASYTYRAAAKELVRQHLRDPGSATFSEVEVKPGIAGNATIVCGKVNARNGFGGMAGPQRFVVGGTTAVEGEVGARS